MTISPSPSTPPVSDWTPSQPRSSTVPDLMSEELQGSTVTDTSPVDVDPQILEALRSKDRLWVLKLGELMEGIITERKARVDVTPSTSYQRLLVHRCSTYYKLSPENDPLSKNVIIVSLAMDSKIISELVPAESTAQPAFKIMRRMQSNRTKPHSQAGSVAGDEGDFSDVEQSETGSLGGRSTASKKRLTIEEREAAYNEARTRIFMDFQEKEKEKEKDMMSASSSTQSVLSGSASTSAGGRSSSMEDLDESVGTPATESEWSAPINRDRKDVRGSSIAGPSSRSLRSGAPSFNGNGQNGTRNSRATSPSFTYASLYEPPPTAPPYDPHQTTGKAPTFIPQYQYGYQPPGNPPHGQQAFMGIYPQYPGYPFPHSAPMPSSDPTILTGQDMYMPVHQHQHQHPVQYAPYPNSYMWPSTHQPHGMSPPTHGTSPIHPSNHGHISTQSAPHFSGSYMPPAGYNPYPVPNYYPPHPGQQVSSPQMMPQQVYPTDPRTVHGMVPGNGRNGPDNSMGPQHNRASSRNGGGHIIGGSAKRGAPPARAAWSYGPGIGMGGFGYGNPSGMATGEVIGPRMNTVRRLSQTSSVASSSTGNRTPADEASSTASSSTTSSSSRRTYTSTTSSQHPLPPRPDWAVGLKPQPTLHTRNHDSMSNSRNSPARHTTQLHNQPMTPVVLQSTDFPPLNPVSPSPEKRTPVVGGAWGNASSTRSILQANVHPGASLGGGRLEDPDRGFERPPPKSNAELFNPKMARRPGSSSSKSNNLTQDRVDEQLHSDVSTNIADQMGSMFIGDAGAQPLAPEAAIRNQSPVATVPVAPTVSAQRARFGLFVWTMTTRLRHRPTIEDEDAAALKLGPGTTCHYHRYTNPFIPAPGRDAPDTAVYNKTLEYVKTFTKFNTTDSASAVRETLRREPALTQFETAQIANLCPADAEEAKSVIPSLVKIDDDKLQVLLDEIQTMRKFQT
ncbi:hypothetical protein HWV62_27563 [Athelia sp. TMB]|nr:hypothetical protein HWV62_27563 [Athelia sp. TMB]